MNDSYLAQALTDNPWINYTSVINDLQREIYLQLTEQMSNEMFGNFPDLISPITYSRGPSWSTTPRGHMYTTSFDVNWRIRIDLSPRKPYSLR